MKQWKAGDIITTAKWTSLNTSYPLAQQVGFYNNSTSIYNIQYDELQDLITHNVICWACSSSGSISILNGKELYKNQNGYAYEQSVV